MACFNSRDSYLARCNGLKRGYAISEKTGRTVFCEDVTKKDGPFYCPRCRSTVIVRKCTEKEDHIAHKSRCSPVLTEKDQTLHTECKRTICNYLSQKYPSGNWEIERPIEGRPEKGLKRIVPDISGRIDNIPIAIEVQKTAYTLNKIKEKTEQYYKRRVYVLWIIPLKQDLGEDDFRPRLFEKYLHAMYYGRAYYWTPTKPNLILPVHFSYSCRYIEPTAFYDEEGEEQSFGGYYLAYKTIKKPNHNGFVDIATDFVHKERPLFKNSKWEEEIPKCKILLDRMETWWSKNEKEKLIESLSNALQDYCDGDDNYDSYDLYE